MNARQHVFIVRRDYNKWVNNQTLEDYALRFTAKKARRWSFARVANTALGAISFLALEAIGGAITLSYGFDNAAFAILVVSALIFLTGLPICYYAARFGVDIDLLTRGAGFGYLGSTITSLIYASFTFIFFALEAAIMAMALKLMFGIPLVLGYVLCSIVVIPLVTHGITFISRFQLWTQPLWVLLQLLPFIYIFVYKLNLVDDWTQFQGLENETKGSLSIVYFGAAAAVLFSLIAQIGEQVDYLRFLPVKTKENSKRWWFSLISAGPGWIIIGAIKLFAGSLLAYIALRSGTPAHEASDPALMYMTAYNYVIQNPDLAVVVAGFFVILSQLKINVTNAYAGSIAWSNFFSRLTHSHPGRVVWLVFNVVIALLLMELGVYQAFEKTLGVYAIVAVAWVGTLVADLVINKPLGLSPNYIEFKRAHLHDINPVGVGAMILGTSVGVLSYLDWFGEIAKALAHFSTLLTTFIFSPLLAVATRSRFYIARKPEIESSGECAVCCVCQNVYEYEDMAHCPAYDGLICSLCCSLDSRCQDMCKTVKKLPEQMLDISAKIFPTPIVNWLSSRFFQFFLLLLVVGSIIGMLLGLIYSNAQTLTPELNQLLASVLWKVFFILMIVAGVICWLFVLAHESRVVAQEESHRQNKLLSEEINAHLVTDKKLQEAKEKAEAANNAKSRYLSGISHELRTPLNSILGYAQLLENDSSLPETRRHQLSVIRHSGEHLADLIEGLLDISKIEAGRLDIHRDFVRIDALLNQIVYMFRLQAEEKGLVFNYNCLNALPEYVTTDEKRLRQILINLLSNAIKFTQSGSVDFTVAYKNQVAEFLIEDSGVGIPEKELERIFQPFERISHPQQSQVGGTGLGLTITRLLTDILGGEIEVANNAKGGATFIVRLMLSRTASPPSEQAPHRRIYGYKGARKKVLVVDDEASHRGLLTDALSPLGFIVLEAEDAETCMQLAREHMPDVFLLDISMPGKDGIALAEELREADFRAPIIMVSAIVESSSEDNAPHIPSTLYNDYIVKPVRLESMLDKLGTLLDLEWNYAPRVPLESSLFTQVPLELSHDSVTLPSEDRLLELEQFAEIGHLSAINATLLVMEKTAEASEEFIAQMRGLAKKVQFDGMLMFLRDCTKAKNSSRSIVNEVVMREKRER